MMRGRLAQYFYSINGRIQWGALINSSDLLSHCRQGQYTAMGELMVNVFDLGHGTQLCGDKSIGHVNKYPTMHYFGIPRLTQSMIAYKILTEYFWNLWKCC